MVPAGLKAKRLSSVNHITKTIHHHQRTCLEWLAFKLATLLKETLTCFPVNIANFLRTPIFIEQLWWLL